MVKHKRWSSLSDLVRIIRARRASNRDAFDEAVRLLETEPDARSKYGRLIPLYRLTLMVCAEDTRRRHQARELYGQKWPLLTAHDRCLDAYRRYLCGGLLGHWETSDAAADELRKMPVRGFIKGLLALPI